MRTKRGFTLIELLVVIAIIGILAAAGLIALSRSQSKARDATRKNDLDQIRKILETYQIDNPGKYPNEGVTGTVDFSATASTLAGELEGAALPDDPRSPDQTYRYRNAYTTASATSWAVSNDTRYYSVMARLEAPKFYVDNPTQTARPVWWHVNSQGGVPFENANMTAAADF